MDILNKQEPVEPEFYTVFAGHEGGWVPLPGYSNETKMGVKDLVLQTARREGYRGTVDGRLLELGWRIEPVFAAPPESPASDVLRVALEGLETCIFVGDEQLFNKPSVDRAIASLRSALAQTSEVSLSSDGGNRESVKATSGDALDAKRYRWLRDKSPTHLCAAPTATLGDGHGIKVVWESYGGKHKPYVFLDGGNLDAQIDGAMAGEAGK